MTDGGAAGYRILVVEDEMLIAMDIATALEELGCEVIGPASTLETALQLARDTALDAAILDVTIRGGKSYPVAYELLGQDIPFVLASGYGNWAIPEALRDCPRLTKPFTTAELEERVRFLCGEAATRKAAAGRVSAADQRR
jgi:DNA-binding response OmpR family regulator